MSVFRDAGYRVTSGFGSRPKLGDDHRGVDLVGGDWVTAIRGGTVIRSRIVTDDNDRTSEWGNYVAVRHGDGSIAYYCHLASRRVSVGERINAGDIVGVTGDTGKAYGRHLHFEVRENGESVDPMPYITASDDADYVCRECGFEPITRAYLDDYRYARDLWRKLRERMEK